jgi:hypothetical protein
MSNFIRYQNISNKLAILNTYHQSILEEYRKNFYELEFKDFTEEQKNHIKKYSQGYPIGYNSYSKAKNKSVNKKGWHIAPLFAEDKMYYNNTKKLPILTKLLEQIGLTTVCAINVLDPGQSLEWHIDKDYIPGIQLYRIIWGLDIIDEENKSSIIQVLGKHQIVETKKVVNKQFYIFHPQLKHRVQNDMQTPRSVLCIDYLPKGYSVL